MIKTIIFDFGGVLGTDADTIFLEILAQNGINKEKALELWNDHWPKLKIGDESVDIFWNTVKKYILTDIDVIIEGYENLIAVNQNALNICSKLKQKGYKLGILSNETSEWMEMKIKKGKLNELFDVICHSADLKSSKPDSTIYLKTLERLNSKPEETLFIDDRDKNIETAEKLGMKCIAFKNTGQLEEELNRILN